MEFTDFKVIDNQQTRIDDLDYTTAGELAIANLEINLMQSQLSTMSAWEFAHWVAVENWLTDYSPDNNATKLDKVRGYLEAFHHLCELSEWEKALKILFLDTSFIGTEKVLHEQLFVWGYYQEQVNFYKRLLNKFGLECDCFLLNGLGKAYGYSGKIELAILCHQEQLNIATEINNYVAQAQAHGGLGKIYDWQLEEYQKSIFHYQQQLEISQKIHDHEQELSAIFGIASAYFMSLNYQQAIKFGNQALSLSQISHNLEKEIEISGFIGIVYSQMGLVKKSIPLIEKQLSLSLKTGNKYQEHLALSRLGIACVNLQQYEIGIEYFQKALKIIDVLGDPISKYRILLNMGVIYAQLGKYVLALEFLLPTFNIVRIMDSKLGEIHCRINIAFCYSCLKQPEAFEHLQIAINLAKNLKSSELLGLSFAVLANYYWHQGNYIYGLILIIKSFWIHPPWKSINGRIMLRSAIKVISKSVMFWKQKDIAKPLS